MNARVTGIVVALLVYATPALCEVRFDVFRQVTEQMQHDAAQLVVQKTAAEATLKEATKKTEDIHTDAVKTAPPSDKTAIVGAEQQVKDAKATIAKVTTVTAAQLKTLSDKLKDFYDQTTTAANRYESTVAAIAIASVIFSLIAAIAGFLKMARTAGIVSLLVTGIVAVPKALPIEDRAKYYRVLSSQSYALLMETQLALAETPKAYDDQVRRFTTIIVYGADKFPNSSNVDGTTADLIKALTPKAGSSGASN